jgi:hypothetical protein
MKTAILGLITLIFSGCAMMAGLNSGNIWTGYGLAAVVWLLFIRHCKRRKKQAAERRFREQQFQLFIKTMQKQH